MVIERVIKISEDGHRMAKVSHDFFFNFFLLGFEPRFGMSLLPSDFMSDRIVPRTGFFDLPTGYRRPWAIARDALQELSKDDRGLQLGKDGFQACIDVHHFKPNEVTVKTVDNTVIIEGKHEERDDAHGSIERHFVRKYVLPKEYDMNAINSTLSSDGVLTVKAPPPAAITNGERVVPITHSAHPVHMSIKDNKKHEENGK